MFCWSYIGRISFLRSAVSFKPYVLENTDAGPGVGISNYEVKFREVELAKLHKSAMRYRVHLATDDQGHNEAERTTAYIGEAIADGCALKTNYFTKHHGLTENEKSDMTIDELTAHEANMIQKNAWCIAEDIASRIDSEPGPSSSFMQAFVTYRKDVQFFVNTEWLNKWRKSGKVARTKLPGHHYFNSIECVMKTHVTTGELFMEFTSCDSCEFCHGINAPIIDPVPQPYPDENTGHYKVYDDTPSFMNDGVSKRPADHFQPRKQCRLLYESDKLDALKQETVNQFCTDYLVEKDVVMNYLHHLADLKLKKTLRRKKKQPGHTKQSEKMVDNEESNDEHHEIEHNSDNDLHGDDIYSDIMTLFSM